MSACMGVNTQEYLYVQTDKPWYTCYISFKHEVIMEYGNDTVKRIVKILILTPVYLYNMRSRKCGVKSDFCRFFLKICTFKMRYSFFDVI